jgi:hypothetical protein
MYLSFDFSVLLYQVIPVFVLTNFNDIIHTILGGQQQYGVTLPFTVNYQELGCKPDISGRIER